MDSTNVCLPVLRSCLAIIIPDPRDVHEPWETFAIGGDRSSVVGDSPDLFIHTPQADSVDQPKGTVSLHGSAARLLISLESFPHESIFGAAGCGYFIGYAVAHLILGYIHYPDHVCLLSGWIHHLTYIALAWRMALVN